MVALGSDGLRVREGGIWTQEKLTYLRRYAEAFMIAMGPKRDEGKWNELIYIDPLCGPGRCIDRGVEFDGSPLIALTVRPAFDHLYLTDRSAQTISALKRRMPQADSLRVTCKKADCKAAVDEIMANFPEKSLGLAFLDPEGFEVDFAVVKALASRAVDILYFFPSMIGVKRNIRQAFLRDRDRLDAVLGSNWRDVPAARFAVGKQLNENELSNLDRSLIHHLREQVRNLGLIYQDNNPPVFRNEQNAAMYHLLFFSKNPAGLKIWNGIKKIAPGGQRSFSGKGF